MINEKRLMTDLEELAEFGRDDSGGITRRSFSREETSARKWFEERLRDAGMQTRVDAAGNIIGRFGKQGPAVAGGSHIDTIRNGGKYDGSLGILAALESVRCIQERGTALANPLEVIAFADEEERFFGFFGSYAMTGVVTANEIEEACDESGIRLSDAMKEYGLDYRRVSEAKRDRSAIKAFVELHIEQGPLLYNQGVPIGVVNGVDADYRFGVSFRGRRDHAGFPMSNRRDAFAAMCSVVQTMDHYRKEIGGNNTRLTVGDVRVVPGIENVVPDQAYCSMDFRDERRLVLQRIESALKDTAEKVTRQSGVTVHVEPILRINDVPFDKEVCDTIREAARDLGIAYRDMQSGAGHDAQVMGQHIPAAMIFVPNTDGRSHCPEEHVSKQHIFLGASVLCRTMERLARA